MLEPPRPWEESCSLDKRPFLDRPAYSLHLLKPSVDSPRPPAPPLLPPGEPPTQLFWLCSLCAGPTATEALGLPLKELLLGARFLPVDITEIISPKPEERDGRPPLL
ncbi:hypothetical protein R6Z07F_011056 [Ovis aries]